MSDHYRTLQVTRDAEPEVIERAYRALARKYHPDTRPATEQDRATGDMQRINAAYAVLSDPDRRRHYDASLAAERASAEPSAWDVFLERGLVGMFLDKMRAQGR